MMNKKMMIQEMMNVLVIEPSFPCSSDLYGGDGSWSMIRELSIAYCESVSALFLSTYRLVFRRVKDVYSQV